MRFMPQEPADLVKACGLCERSADHLIDLLDMLSGSDLRNNAAVFLVHFYLGVDGIGQYPPSVPHDCCGCLIAGALYS